MSQKPEENSIHAGPDSHPRSPADVCNAAAAAGRVARLDNRSRCIAASGCSPSGAAPSDPVEDELGVVPVECDLNADVGEVTRPALNHVKGAWNRGKSRQTAPN